jgi:hypothetical protein
VTAKGQADRDWRDEAAYRPLLVADRSLIAWEWLRRDSGYRSAVSEAPGGCGKAAERWGLHAFEQPERSVPEARPLWRSDMHAFVLAADAVPPGLEARASHLAGGPAGARDLFDLSRFGPLARLVADRGGAEYLLLSDGLRTIRLDIESGTLSLGPVRLAYRLSGLASAEKPLLVLRRLLALSCSGGFSRSLHRRSARARRWVATLRAQDALMCGASQREIAALLLIGAAPERCWRTRSPSLRLQAQRLVRSARAMAAGGYVELLR